jgi:hypothetical protein
MGGTSVGWMGGGCVRRSVCACGWRCADREGVGMGGRLRGTSGGQASLGVSRQRDGMRCVTPSPAWGSKRCRPARPLTRRVDSADESDRRCMGRWRCGGVNAGPGRSRQRGVDPPVSRAASPPRQAGFPRWGRVSSQVPRSGALWGGRVVVVLVGWGLAVDARSGGGGAPHPPLSDRQES